MDPESKFMAEDGAPLNNTIGEGVEPLNSKSTQGLEFQSKDLLHNNDSPEQEPCETVFEDHSVHRSLGPHPQSSPSELMNANHNSEQEALDWENKLKAAQESVQDLERKLSHAEEAITVNKMESAEKISVLLHELEKAKTDLEASSVDESKLKSMEIEAARLTDELCSSKSEVTDLKIKVQMAQEGNAQLTSQVEGLAEKVSMLEGQLATAEQKINEAEESLLAQIKAHQAELTTKESSYEFIQNAHGRLQMDLEASKSRALELETALSGAVDKTEEHHKEAKRQKDLFKGSLDKSQALAETAEAKFREADQKIKSLELELVEMQHQLIAGAKIGEILNETKDQLAKVEEEYSLLKKNLTQIEQDYADEKMRAVELDSNLKSMEEITRNQLENIKVAEESAEKSKEQVLDLERVFKVAEDKLKSTEKVAESLQLEVNALNEREVTAGECLKEAEAKSEKLEIELQEKVEAYEERCHDLQTSMFQLEQNSSRLQDTLVVANVEAETAKKKVSELELALETLQHTKDEFEERLRISEEESLHHATNADSLVNSGIELESMIKQHKTEAYDAGKQVTELEAALLDAQDKGSEIEMKLKSAQDNSAMFENSVSELSKKVAELEESVRIFESQAKESSANMVDLETAYASSKQKEQELIESIQSAEQRLMQKETEAKDTGNRILELEACIADMEIKSKVVTNRADELQAALEEARNKELALAEKVGDTERELSQQNILLEQATKKALELEGSIESSRIEADEAKNRVASIEALLVQVQEKCVLAETDVKHLTGEWSLLEEKLAAMETHHANIATELMQAEHKITELQPLGDKLRDSESLVITLKEEISAADERLSKVEADSQAANLSESKLREELSFHRSSNSNLQESLVQIQSEKQAIIAQLDSTQKSFAELDKQLIQERQQLQRQMATIMQENGDLAEKAASLQGKLHDTLLAAEVSAKSLQESSLREVSLDGDVRDLKVQLEKAVKECSYIEELKQQLKDSVTKEEHQAHINQLLDTSNSFERKLAEAEKEISKSKLEINKVQKAYMEQETVVKELEVKAAEMDTFDNTSSGTTKARDFNFGSTGVARQRKRGVNKEVLDVSTPKMRENGKHSQLSTHSSHHMLFVLSFISLLSLIVGFWIAQKIYL